MFEKLIDLRSQNSWPCSRLSRTKGLSRLARLPILIVVFLVGTAYSPSCSVDKRVRAQEPTESKGQDNLAGHSFHGESFNQGPRQAAYLMPGMAPIRFPITTNSPLAQKFFEQGIAQLHGFWFFEAERSFRQVAAIDPQCAMAYWGMAMANKENIARARGFMKKGLERKDKASDREQAYLNLLAKYLSLHNATIEEDKRTREEKALDYDRDLDQLIQRFPDDLEAKAFLCYRLWEGEREELPIPSRIAVDALLDQVFAANPMHPAHHYRIHLWDGRRAERALGSAARCGQSSPGIAHMWHMSGHTYSELKRYHDAVYQQEASARVDHSHMMRDRVLPDQIHNFAHNNEWLIRNMLAIGRIDDAISLAKNMTSLPRHPTYNSLEKGSSRYGFERLLLALNKYRLWELALQLEDSVWLDPGTQETMIWDKKRLMIMAAYHCNQLERGDAILAEFEAKTKQLEDDLQKWSEEAPAPNDPPTIPEYRKASWDAFQAARKKVAEEIQKLNEEHQKWAQRVAECKAHRFAKQGDFQSALAEYAKVKDHDLGWEAEWRMSAGEIEKGLEVAKQLVASKAQEVVPLAVAAYVAWQSKRVDEAKSYFEPLRKLACDANLDTPLLSRLQSLALEVGAGERWSLRPEPVSDAGERPLLDLLGPLRWSPYASEDWALEQSDGSVRSLKALRGKPSVILFYLGFGCLHCMEQLKAFSPKIESFQNQGVEVLAISSESMASLRKGIEEFGQPIAIPLLADPDLRVFRRFRCYDDFEQMPLHGTFFVDGEGRVLWQDIGHEPFSDVDFLISEIGRQLKIQANLD